MHDVGDNQGQPIRGLSFKTAHRRGLALRSGEFLRIRDRRVVSWGCSTHNILTRGGLPDALLQSVSDLWCRFRGHAGPGAAQISSGVRSGCPSSNARMRGPSASVKAECRSPAISDAGSPLPLMNLDLLNSGSARSVHPRPGSCRWLPPAPPNGHTGNPTTVAPWFF